MAEKGKGRSSRQSSATPDEVLTTGSASLPSGDYSYVLEIVMHMQRSLGALTEAVDALKEQSKEQSKELRTISQDVHAARIVVGLVGGLIVLVGGIIAWLVNTYISTQTSP